MITYLDSTFEIDRLLLEAGIATPNEVRQGLKLSTDSPDLIKFLCNQVRWSRISVHTARYLLRIKKAEKVL